MNISEQYKEKFRTHLQQLGYSKSSCQMLPECLCSFLEYHNLSAIESATQNHIQSFYDWLHQRPNRRKSGGLSDNYIYHHIYALKLFFRYCEEIGEIKYNPISAMKFKRPEYSEREPLSKNEVQELFKASISKKETAILHLFYSCGLRRSEVVALNIKDLHLKEKLLFVRKGKGAKRRAVPMAEKVVKQLEDYYLHCRHTAQTDLQEAFILNQKNRRMSGNSYNIVLKRIVKNSSLQRNVTLHQLRHSIATHLLESGLPVESVRDFLGHKHLESTQIYTKVIRRI